MRCRILVALDRYKPNFSKLGIYYCGKRNLGAHTQSLARRKRKNES